MRVTKEVAAQNREKILETATSLFKTRGFDNVSVADLTKAAGFTHGGFYNHFESKSDLEIQAIDYAFDQALHEIAGGSANSIGSSISMTKRLENYLTREHRDEPHGGCPTASLAIDVGRQAVDAQRAFAGGLERYIALIEDVFPSNSEGKRNAAIATLAGLVGGIILSRAVRNGKPELSEEILRACQFDSAS